MYVLGAATRRGPSVAGCSVGSPVRNRTAEQEVQSGVRKAQVLLGSAMAVALAGCGGEPPPVPYATAPLATLPVLDSTQAAALTSLPWTLASVDDSGRLVTVETAGDACRDVRGVTIRSSATVVTLTVLGTTTGTCPSATLPQVRAILLPEPLGTRTLRP